MTQHFVTTRGRDFMYETPEEMQEKIDEYFDLCEAEQRRPLLTGLTRHLGFSYHQQFNKQVNRPGFLDLVCAAKLRVSEHYEDALLTGKGTQGAIFALTNIKTEPGEDGGEGSAAWATKQQTELTGKGGEALLKGLRSEDLPFFIDQLKSLLEAGEGA